MPSARIKLRTIFLPDEADDEKFVTSRSSFGNFHSRLEVEKFRTNAVKYVKPRYEKNGINVIKGGRDNVCRSPVQIGRAV